MQFVKDESSGTSLVLISSPVCTWAVYFLTTSEDVQQNLYKEMDRVLGKGPITHEKIEQLRYCRQVLCETVRTAKLTPIAAQLQELEGRVDQHGGPRCCVLQPKLRPSPATGTEPRHGLRLRARLHLLRPHPARR